MIAYLNVLFVLSGVTVKSLLGLLCVCHTSRERWQAVTVRVQRVVCHVSQPSQGKNMSMITYSDSDHLKGQNHCVMYSDPNISLTQVLVSGLQFTKVEVHECGFHSNINTNKAH